MGVVPPSELASAPASAAWPGVSIFSTHTLPNHQTQQTPITTVSVQLVASFLLNVQGGRGESCLFLQLFCQNQLLQQRRAGRAAAAGGRTPAADGGSSRQGSTSLPVPPPLFNAANALRMGAGSIGQLDPKNLEQSNQRPNEPI